MTAFFVSMNLKWLFLFLLIGLPVGIYLFLQSFGDNHFDIPIYFENGLEPIEGCALDTNQSQYAVEFFFDGENDIEQSKAIVYGSKIGKSQNVRTNLLTLLNRQAGTDMLYISLVSDSLKLLEFGNYNHAITVFDSLHIIEPFIRCGLRVNSNNSSTLVLVDKNRRVRGYYDPSELKEVDRLNTELEILRSNEQK